MPTSRQPANISTQRCGAVGSPVGYDGEEVTENDCTAIAFKNLKHIRKRISNGSKFQRWAFRELQRHVEYKAEEHGIDVDGVKPQYTSQQCSHSKCGFTHDDNRDGDEFECLKCGKELHSDYAVRAGVHRFRV